MENEEEGQGLSLSSTMNCLDCCSFFVAINWIYLVGLLNSLFDYLSSQALLTLRHQVPMMMKLTGRALALKEAGTIERH